MRGHIPYRHITPPRSGIDFSTKGTEKRLNTEDTARQSCAVLNLIYACQSAPGSIEELIHFFISSFFRFFIDPS
jgi:hypothetical protein